MLELRSTDVRKQDCVVGSSYEQGTKHQHDISKYRRFSHPYPSLWGPPFCGHPLSWVDQKDRNMIDANEYLKTAPQDSHGQGERTCTSGSTPDRDDLDKEISDQPEPCILPG